MPVPANVRYFDTPFLTDIAHNADPSPQDTDNNPATPPVAPTRTPTTRRRRTSPHQPAGTYDDEMLNAHFICGDGRCNENIALSADPPDLPLRARPAGRRHQGRPHRRHVRRPASRRWRSGSCRSPQSPDGWNGERLFQAARFVTEMEYQHLVFEEFARKVQPAINPFEPFHVYSPDINPAIEAEFAHAVYRFGHSMLDDDVAARPTTGRQQTTTRHLAARRRS